MRFRKKKKALSDKTEARVDHIHEDVNQSVDVNTVKAVSVGSAGDHTEKGKSSETHSEHLDFDDDDT